jgi:hypothetical protein
MTRCVGVGPTVTPVANSRRGSSSRSLGRMGPPVKGLPGAKAASAEFATGVTVGPRPCRGSLPHPWMKRSTGWGTPCVRCGWQSPVRVGRSWGGRAAHPPEFCLRGAAAVRRRASHPLPRRQPRRGIAPARIFFGGPGAGVVVPRKRPPRRCRRMGGRTAAGLRSRLGSSRGVQQQPRRAAVKGDAAAGRSDCDVLRPGSFEPAGPTRSQSETGYPRPGTVLG